MKIATTLLILAVVIATAVAAEPPAHAGRRTPVAFDELKASFAQPDMLYAPFMFCFWDDPLDGARATEIAGKLAGQRINPGYACARHATADAAAPLALDQWRSPLWLDTIADVLKVAGDNKSYFSFCDEYWWPRGRAGSRVLEAHPELRAVSLEWKTLDPAPGQPCELPASFFTVAAQHAEPFDATAAARAVGPALGNWIWTGPTPTDGQTAWFRKSFDLPADAKIKSARIKITADDEFMLYCNSAFIGEDDDWKLPEDLELIAAVKPGANTIAIEVYNEDGAAGLIAGITVELETGEPYSFGTDAEWRASNTHAVGWNLPDFDHAAWASATVVGALDAPPWNLEDRGARHSKCLIKSSTLTVIGAGDAFTWTPPSDGQWRVYSFDKIESTGIDNSTVNYLDNRLADAFIKIALEPYAERFAAQFGNTIPGILMDTEGDYGYKLAWSDRLDACYREKTGRDIRLWMPLMLDDDAEGLYAKARYDWFDVVSDIYAQFFATVNQWCVDRGLYLTGHLREENLMLQAVAVGDVFQAQRAFSMPGADALGRKALDPHDFKEAQSVAEFEGRRMAGEALGAAGWNMSPFLMKKAVNSLTAWGVSHIIPHGLFMTRQFDGNYWPPDWYDENPYFRYLHLWSDFARRASYVNACGAAQPEVLLYYPMDSIWALSADGMFDPSESGGFNEIDHWFGEQAHHIDAIYTAAINRLADLGAEFLIADDEYLRRMTIEDRRLLLGDAKFWGVLLPPVTVMPLEIARKLVDFAKASGRVFVLGDLPSGSTDNGMNDPQMAALMKELLEADGYKRLTSLSLNTNEMHYFSPTLQLNDGAFPMLQRRIKIDGRDFFWLANRTGQPQHCDASCFDVAGVASIWDCETGQIRPVEVQESEERHMQGKDMRTKKAFDRIDRTTRVRLAFQPYEAYWLVIDPQAPPRPEQNENTQPFITTSASQAAEMRRESTGATDIAGPWRVTIDPADQPTPLKPIEIPDEFKAGVEKPLQDWNAWGLPTFSGFVDYAATFEFSGDTSTASLDLGRVMHMAEVWLNGEHLGPRLWPPHIYDVSKVVKPGANTIKIKVGNLIDKNLGGKSESGLFGPVRVTFKKPPEPEVVPAPEDTRKAEEALKAWKERLKSRSPSLGRARERRGRQ